MGILSKLSSLFGSQEQPDGRLQAAENYVESQWTSGLTRHYDAGAVVDCVEMGAGVQITAEEAVTVVEKVRKRHGWKRRPHDSYFPPEDEE